MTDLYVSEGWNFRPAKAEPCRVMRNRVIYLPRLTGAVVGNFYEEYHDLRGRILLVPVGLEADK